MNQVKVHDILQSPFAVSTEEGESIFKLIDDGFSRNQDVVVNFEQIDLIISTFLNAAIGQLYGRYSTEYIQQHLSIEGMPQDDLGTLKLVTDRAKEYFKDKRGFENVAKKNMPDAEE
jgi:hypothetical protein